jgi:hypothetical protein
MGRFWRREKSLASTGIGNPDSPARSIVTETTTLLRLTNYKKKVPMKSGEWKFDKRDAKRK